MCLGNLPTVLKKPDRYLKTAAEKAMTKEWLTENFPTITGMDKNCSGGPRQNN